MISLYTVDRAGWNARPATKTLFTTWAQRDLVVFHHTGAGDETASVRGIQDYCMNTKGHSDIDYNVLIRNDDSGTIYEGRQGVWLTIGSHCLNNNTRSIGVCFITKPNAPLTAAAMAAGRWIYGEAIRRQAAALGSAKIKARVHSDLVQTDCPMSVITQWVRAGMPAEGTNMGQQITSLNVQTALRDAGYDLGKLDDDWGPRSQAALTKCYTDANRGGGTGVIPPGTEFKAVVE